MPNTTLDLPENLGARCSLLYVWDEDYTLRALEGYLQFMELKANFEDWDAEHLAPSGVIDFVWQQHLLYNKQYAQACVSYCENVIGYDPDVALIADHNALQEQRVKTTKIALKALYGRGYDKDVWNFTGTSEVHKKGKVTFTGNGTVATEENNNATKETIDSGPLKKTNAIAAARQPSRTKSPLYDTRQDTEQESATDNAQPPGIHRDETISDTETISESELRIRNSSSNLSASNRPQHNRTPNSGKQTERKSNTSTPAESVTVKIKCFVDGKTQDTCIRVKRTTKMKKVEDCLARLMNLDSADSLRFLVDGEQVSPWETLESMKVKDPEQHWFTVMPKVGDYQ